MSAFYAPSKTNILSPNKYKALSVLGPYNYYPVSLKALHLEKHINVQQSDINLCLCDNFIMSKATVLQITFGNTTSLLYDIVCPGIFTSGLVSRELLLKQWLSFYTWACVPMIMHNKLRTTAKLL